MIGKICLASSPCFFRLAFRLMLLSQWAAWALENLPLLFRLAFCIVAVPSPYVRFPTGLAQSNITLTADERLPRGSLQAVHITLQRLHMLAHRSSLQVVASWQPPCCPRSGIRCWQCRSLLQVVALWQLPRCTRRSAAASDVACRSLLQVVISGQPPSCTRHCLTAASTLYTSLCSGFRRWHAVPHSRLLLRGSLHAVHVTLQRLQMFARRSLLQVV